MSVFSSAQPLQNILAAQREEKLARQRERGPGKDNLKRYYRNEQNTTGSNPAFSRGDYSYGLDSVYKHLNPGDMRRGEMEDFEFQKNLGGGGYNVGDMRRGEMEDFEFQKNLRGSGLVFTPAVEWEGKYEGKDRFGREISVPKRGDNLGVGGGSVPPINQYTSDGGGINISPTFENIGNPTVNVTGPSMGNLRMGGGSSGGTATRRTPGTTTPDSTPSTQGSGDGTKKRAKTKAAAKLLTRMETRGEGDKISRKEIRTAIKKEGAQAVNRALQKGDYNVGLGAQKIIDRRFG